jgi:O-antigen ligase
MIRLALLNLFIFGVIIYAWRDWYKSLCGLILLMAVMEHPDMPKTLFGIQGLNPWNIGMAITVLAWWVHRQKEGLSWDLPRKMNVLLVFCLIFILIGFYRMLIDRGGLIEYALITETETPSTAYLWGEHLINSIKWVIPGLMLYDGCRSRSRFVMGLISLLGIYFLLAVQVIKWMPLSSVASGDILTARSAKILLHEIGYHRVNLSVMLAGASWAIFSTRGLLSNRKYKILVLAASLAVLFGQALTGGRAGYVTWAVVGFSLCLVRWRRYLLVAPVIVILIAGLIPGTAERIFQGFDAESRDTNVLVERFDSNKMVDPEGRADLYTISAGRNIAWPYVIEKIWKAPFWGYGREAMQRTGISAFLWQEFGESFPHPHNAYLQWILDNGWIGFLPVAIFYLLLLKYSLSLFRDSRNPIFVTIGGVTLSLVLALLAASFSSQTFYPREGAIGMWCAIGLMLRIFVERSNLPEGSPPSVLETLGIDVGKTDIVA